MVAYIGGRAWQTCVCVCACGGGGGGGGGEGGYLGN